MKMREFIAYEEALFEKAGLELKKFREEKNLSLEEVEAGTDIGDIAIRMMEMGYNFNLYNAYVLADFYGKKLVVKFE